MAQLSPVYWSSRARTLPTQQKSPFSSRKDVSFRAPNWSSTKRSWEQDVCQFKVWITLSLMSEIVTSSDAENRSGARVEANDDDCAGVRGDRQNPDLDGRILCATPLEHRGCLRRRDVRTKGENASTQEACDEGAWRRCACHVCYLQLRKEESFRANMRVARKPLIAYRRLQNSA